MSCQIAAVDGGYVSWLERSKIARVVPVVEVTAHALQATHRRERRLKTIDRLTSPDPTEIASANDRKKIEADIGRRGPMRDRRRRIVLKIVGRQHVVADVTKVSKNRQVRRAVRLSACASASVIGR